MKKIIFLFIALLSLLSCSTTKKMSEVTTSEKKQSDKIENEKTYVETKIDTSKLANLEVTYTRIEFFDPARNTKEYKSGPESEEGSTDATEESVPNGKVVKPPGKGSVKSIESWTIKQTKENKGQSVSTNVSDKNKKESDLVDNDTSSTSQEAPAPDPYRWRYLFYTLVLIVGVLIYLKRTPLFKWINAIISRIKAFLTK